MKQILKDAVIQFVMLIAAWTILCVVTWTPVILAYMTAGYIGAGIAAVLVVYAGVCLDVAAKKSKAEKAQ